MYQQNAIASLMSAPTITAEVMPETSEGTYVEGVWVNANNRGTRLGQRCMSQRGRNFLLPSNSICLLVSGGNPKAHNFYREAGYKLRGGYDTTFLK